ncbi:DUF6443 domain-containing protein [uncultured Fibrella sp.]|uniref:RHS repeat domain-containing protein n=1 Tax=uncultured Fibrella sp. TaxID=1284596 RepID=UPI0035CBD788
MRTFTQRLLCTSLGIVLFLTGRAQEKKDTLKTAAVTGAYAPSIVPPSPNAATMGRYGDLPVNLSNGLPNPNLTLFTDTDKDINWTVGMAYNYPGFIPSAEAGPLGHGWTLVGGGTITRVIRGFEDEKNQGQGGQQGYYYSRTQIGALLNNNGRVICSSCPPGFLIGTLDGQPDLFSFQAGPLSGQFFIGEDGQFHIVSDHKLKIEWTLCHTSSPINGMLEDNIMGFQITAEDGTVYYFGMASCFQRPLTNIELVYNGSDWLINAWHLTRIVSPQAGQINFTYSNHCIPNTFGVINPRFTQSRRSARLVPTGTVGDVQYEESITTGEHAENHLTHIRAINWTLAIATIDSLSMRLVRRLSVWAKTSSTDSTLRRSIHFGYGDYDRTALLTSVVQQAGSRTDSLYRFDYWAKRPASVDGTTFGLDHWNYFNGQTTNTTLIPQLGANRNPDLTSTRLGALSRIRYPTGGSTSFDYEPNEFSFLRADSLTYNSRGESRGLIGRQPHGGLRLKTATDLPVWGGQPIVRQYSYTKLDNPTLSSGVVAELSNQAAYVLSLPLEYNCGFGQGNCNTTYTIYRSDPFYQMARNPVYYTNVRVQTGSDQVSEHRFTGHKDYADSLGYAYGLLNRRVGPTGDVGLARSMPLSVRHYSGGTLVAQTSYSYALVERHRARAYFWEVFMNLTANGQGFQNNKGYFTYSGWLQKIAETETRYYGGAALSNTTSYTYANATYLQPTRMTQSESKAVSLTSLPGAPPSRVIETTLKYPYDFPANTTLSAMTNLNQLRPVIEKQVSLVERTASGGSNVTPIRFEQTSYGSFTGPATVIYYLPTRIDYRIGVGPLQNGIELLTYDGRANLTSYRDPGGQTTQISYFTAGGKADKPRVYTVGGGTTGTVLARSVSYDYAPLLGLSSTTALTGYVSSYDYDGFGRLLRSRDQDGNVLAQYAYHLPGQPTPAGIGASPSTALPYVVSQIAREAQTTLGTAPTQTQTAIGYLDGLGRPLQTVGWQAAPDLADALGETSVYDAYGRASKQILPTGSNGVASGLYRSDADMQAATFYGDSRPFGETIFENTPLGRPLKQYGPGQAFRNANADKFIESRHAIGGNEVTLYTVVSGGLSTSNTYPDGSLSAEQMLTEQGLYRIIFRDKAGRMVSRGDQAEAGNLNSFLVTDYVYDELGQLRYVLPPKAKAQLSTLAASLNAKGELTFESRAGPLKMAAAQQAGLSGANAVYAPVTINDTDALLLEGIYAYRYDDKGQQVEKHVPGAGWQQTVYDKRYRPVLVRDEKDGSTWRFTQYDALGRIVRTGLLPLASKGNPDRATLQAQFDGVAVPYEEYQSANATDLYYSNQSFYADYRPLLDIKLASLYDTYSWQTDASYNFQAGNAFSQPQLGNVTGLVTGSFERNLNTGAWYKNVVYYDAKSRPIQTFGQNVNGTIDRLETRYRFNGEILQVRSVQQGKLELTTHQYDHMGRKTAIDHQIDSKPVQRLSSYEYDAIGRLRSKRLSGAAGSGSATSQQSGPWSTGSTWQSGNVPGTAEGVTIAPGHMVTVPGNVEAGQLFAQGTVKINNNARIRLNGQSGGGSGTGIVLQVVDYSYHIRGGLRGINTDQSGNLQPGKLFAMKLGYEDDGTYYNGNIRSQSWRAKLPTDSLARSYTYSYDGVDRLTGAIYGGGTSGENYTTDGMSYDANGNLLTLNRTGRDQLSYSYLANSNKLLSITDAVSGTAAFVDGNKTGDDYAYNADGSQSKDLNKGITAITYNYLKLPTGFTLSNGTVVSYQYSATGRKLKKTVVANGTTTTTDYIGNHVYQNGVLYQIAHAEGRIIPQGTDYQYQWSLTDHLGNLRVSFIAGTNGKAQVVQSQDYDPWGWQLQGLGTLPSSTSDKYKYNGKEEQAETGLYDYGARFYGATEGRWGVIDPMAEATYSQSPFGYVGSNPVRNTDPTGMLSDEEYRKWAKEADALSERVEQQGVGAYSALAQDGPGDKNKKAIPQQHGTKQKQANQSQTKQAEAGAGAILVGTSTLSKVGTAVEVVTEATLEGIATLGRFAAIGIGAGLAVLASGVVLHGDESTTQKPDEPDPFTFYHYTNEAGLAGIMASGKILPDRKGNVYITQEAMAPVDVFQNIFLSQPTHKGRGNFMVVFELRSDQVSRLRNDPSQPLELVYSFGTLKLPKIIYGGPNLIPQK